MCLWFIHFVSMLYILHIVLNKVGHVNFFVHVAHIQVSTNNEDSTLRNFPSSLLKPQPWQISPFLINKQTVSIPSPAFVVLE
jgi:hypothetical protein